MAHTASRSGNRSQGISFSYTQWLIMLGAALLIAFGILAFLHLTTVAVFVLSALFLEIGIVIIVSNIKKLAGIYGYGQNPQNFDDSRSDLIIITCIGLLSVAAGVGAIYVVATGIASAGLAFLAPFLPAMGGGFLAIGAIALCVICMCKCYCPQPASSNVHTNRETAFPNSQRVRHRSSSINSAEVLITESALNLEEKSNQDTKASPRQLNSTYQSKAAESLARHSFASDTRQSTNFPVHQSAEQPDPAAETYEQVVTP